MSAPLDRWIYARDRRGLERGLWEGGRPPVFRPHFHAEAQLTVVTAGWRLFDVGGEAFTVSAGQCLYIPAGLVHQGIDAGDSFVHCINTYAPLSLGDRPLVVAFGRGEAAEAIGRPVAATGAVRMGIDLPDGAIGAIAADAGVSREHFSRRFRRAAGIGPQGFRLQRRLNEARSRLRGPEPIAAIAADLGFADQSHLGRLFRQAFGVAPMAYRRMMRITSVPDGIAPAC